MITLELKEKTTDGNTFFRFRLNSFVQFWFVLYNRKNIYSVNVCVMTNIFPLSKASFYPVFTKEGDYISGFEVNTASLVGNAQFIEGCMKELESAKEIIEELTQFFNEEFRVKYMQEV